MLPNGPIFSDFGPESDFFEQNGPELVRITPLKSGLGDNKQRQFKKYCYLRDLDRSEAVVHHICRARQMLSDRMYWRHDRHLGLKIVIFLRFQVFQSQNS